MNDFNFRALYSIVFVLCALAAPGFSMALRTSGPDPVWIKSPPADKNYIYFVGSSTASAKAAYENAIQQAALDFSRRIAASQKSLTVNYGLETLQEYVRRFSKETDKHSTQSGRSLQYFSLLRIGRAYAEPFFIQQFAVVRRSPDLAVGQFTVDLAGKEVQTNLRVPVRSAKADDGSFFFVFTMRRQPDDLYVRLDQIEVVEDGGTGSTGWVFDITINNAKLLSLAERKYNDEVGKYAAAYSDRALYPLSRLSNTGAAEIKITGRRP